MAAVLNHSRSRGTDKVVLLGIANHDGDGGAWPSIETLAWYANVDERTVRRSIRTLVAMGELAVDANAGGRPGTRNDRRPNLYHVLVTGPASGRQRDGRTPVSSRTDPTGGHVRPPREDAGVRDGGTWASPEPSLEPSSEPSEEPPGPPTTTAVDKPRTARKCKRHQRPRRDCSDCQIVIVIPPWCGECDPHGEHDLAARMVCVYDPESDEDRWTWCPRCHPVVGSVA
jgi:hypothetical protein